MPPLPPPTTPLALSPPPPPPLRACGNVSHSRGRLLLLLSFRSPPPLPPLDLDIKIRAPHSNRPHTLRSTPIPHTSLALLFRPSTYFFFVPLSPALFWSESRHEQLHVQVRLLHVGRRRREEGGGGEGEGQVVLLPPSLPSPLPPSPPTVTAITISMSPKRAGGPGTLDEEEGDRTDCILSPAAASGPPSWEEQQ
jgi:hypothetical protein